ncbi:Beige/BEACH domain containing protein [Entamoeba marina]
MLKRLSLKTSQGSHNSPTHNSHSIPYQLQPTFNTFYSEKSLQSIISVLTVLTKNIKRLSDMLNVSLKWEVFIDCLIKQMTSLSSPDFIKTFCSTESPYIHTIYLIISYRPDLLSKTNAVHLKTYLLVVLPELYDDTNIGISPRYRFNEQIQLVPTIIQTIDTSSSSTVLFPVLQIISVLVKNSLIPLDNFLLIDVPLQHIDSFIDYYYEIFQLYSSLPQQIEKMIQQWVTSLLNQPIPQNNESETQQTDLALSPSKIPNYISNTDPTFELCQVMRFCLMISYCFPSSTLDFEPIFPWKKSQYQINAEVLLYYYNYVICADQTSLDKRLKTFLDVMLQTDNELINALVFCQSRLLVVLHSHFPEYNVLEPLVYLVKNEPIHVQKILFKSIFMSLAHFNYKEANSFVALVQSNEFCEVVCPIVQEQILLMSQTDINEIFVGYGVSYQLRTKINEDNLFIYLSFLLQLFITPPLTQDFLTSEPRSFFYKIASYSSQSNEIYDLVISYLTTGILSSKTFERFLQLLPNLSSPQSIQMVTHRLNVMKLYSLRNNEIPHSVLKQYYSYLITSLTSTNQSVDSQTNLSEYYAVIFSGFSAFKGHPEYNHELGLFLKSTSTLEILVKVFDLIGNDLFTHLRNLSLDQLHVIDEPLFLEVFVELLQMIPTSDSAFHELLPLLDNPTNVDTISRSHIVDKLLVLISRNSPINSLYYFLRVIISYHCSPTFLTALLKNSHEFGLHSEHLSLLNECTFSIPQPRVSAEFSLQTTTNFQVPLRYEQTSVLSITFWAAIMTYPDFTKDSYLSLLDFSLKDFKFHFQVSSTSVALGIESSHNPQPLQVSTVCSIHTRQFFNATLLLRTTTKALDVAIAIDGNILCSERVTCTLPASFLPLDFSIKAVESGRFRIGNVHFFKEILSEEAVKFISSTRPDILPTDWQPFPPLNEKSKVLPTDYFATVAVPYKTVIGLSKQCCSELKCDGLSVYRCVAVKEALNAVGGLEVLLMLLAEVKDVDTAFGLIRVIDKFLMNNRFAALEYHRIHAGRILTEILSYTSYNLNGSPVKLTDIVDLVQLCLKLCVKDIFIESSVLLKDVFFHAAFWMRCSGDVFIEYVKAILMLLDCEHRDHNTTIMMDSGCLLEFFSYVPVVVGLRMQSLQNIYVKIISQLLASSSWKYILNQISTIIAQYCVNISSSTPSPFYNEISHKMTVSSPNLHGSKNSTLPQTPRTKNVQLFCLEIISAIVQASFNFHSSENYSSYISVVHDVIPLDLLISLISIAHTPELLTPLIKLLENYISSDLDDFQQINGGFARIFHSLRSIDVCLGITPQSIDVIWELASGLESEKYVFMLGELKQIRIDVVQYLFEMIKKKNIPKTKEIADCLWGCILNITDDFYEESTKIHQFMELIIDVFASFEKEGILLCDEMAKFALHKELNTLRWELYCMMAIRQHHIIFPNIVLIRTYQTLQKMNCSFFKKLSPSNFLSLQKNLLITQTFQSLSTVILDDPQLYLFYAFLMFGVLNNILQEPKETLIAHIENIIQTLPPQLIYAPLYTLLQPFLSDCTEETKTTLQNSTGDINSAIEWLVSTCTLPLPLTQPIWMKSFTIQHTKKPTTVIELYDSTDIVAALAWRSIVKCHTTEYGTFSYQFQEPFSLYKLESTLCNGNTQMIVRKTKPKPSTLPVENQPQEEMYRKYENMYERVKFRLYDELESHFIVKVVKWDKELPGIVHINEHELLLRYHKNGECNMVSRECKQISISFNEIVSIHRLDINYESVGIEIYYFYSLKSQVLIFNNSTDRTDFLNKIPIQLNETQRLSDATKKWCKGDISNYEYLHEINRAAHRSYRLLSQYPIYPWVIATFGEEFRLNDIRSYRDLSHPIALHDQRSRDEIERSFEEKNCHYNCYMSSPSLVCRSLVRLQPYAGLLWTEMSERCFEVGGRVFRCIEALYKSSVEQSRAELIPQFYTTPEFLCNSNHFLTRHKSLSDEHQALPLEDVSLPAWSQTPREFIRKSRAALESDNVTNYLHHWIDLTFGSLQQVQSALNVYNNDYTIHSEQPSPIKQTIWTSMGHLPPQLFTKPHLLRSPLKTTSIGINAAARQPKKIASVKHCACLLPDTKSYAVREVGVSIGDATVMYDESRHHVIVTRGTELPVIVAAIAGVRCVCGDLDWIISGGDNVVGIQNNNFKSYYGLCNVDCVGICVGVDSVAGGNADGDVVVWGLRKRRIRWIKRLRSPVINIEISPFGSVFVVCYNQFDDATIVYAFDINGTQFGCVEIKTKITAVCVSKNLNSSIPVLALGTCVGEILLYDASTMNMIFSYSADRNTKEVTAFLFTEKDSKLYYSVFKDNYYNIYCL